MRGVFYSGNMFQVRSYTQATTKLAFEPVHEISNYVAFRHVQTRTNLCNLLLSLETPNDVRSVA